MIKVDVYINEERKIWFICVEEIDQVSEAKKIVLLFHTNAKEIARGIEIFCVKFTPIKINPIIKL